MLISARDLGKRYNREWIFRHFNYKFLPGGHYAITGSNGSGKSTLLQVLAGSVMHSEGLIEYMNAAKIIEAPFSYLSVAAPYLELIEEMTATEFLSFHQVFKPSKKPITEALMEVGLASAATKQIRYYSSGMKQRLKMAQAFFCMSPVLLLDEPTTNLDMDGIALYHHLIQTYAREKLVIISSNDPQEYNFCKEVIAINDYK